MNIFKKFIYIFYFPYSKSCKIYHMPSFLTLCFSCKRCRWRSKVAFFPYSHNYLWRIICQETTVVITFGMMTATERRDNILSRHFCCYCLYFSKIVFDCVLGEPYERHILLYLSINHVYFCLENILVLTFWYSQIEDNASFFLSWTLKGNNFERVFFLFPEAVVIWRVVW